MENINKIISDLKFLTSIKQNDKINTRSLYLQTDGILTSIMRSLSFDNRHNTLIFIRETINGAFQLLSYYEETKKKSDVAMCNNIINDLIKSKIGLNNLISTYTDDTNFVCNIKTIIQTIDTKMLDIKGKYKIEENDIMYSYEDNLNEEDTDDVNKVNDLK
jgi:hypothetical protein